MGLNDNLNYLSELPPLGYGEQKDVFGPDKDGYVYKVFKDTSTPLSLCQQMENLTRKKQYFWKFMPETQICPISDGGYYIKQKYISGKFLKDTDVNLLSHKSLSQLLDLLNCYLSYAKVRGNLDITGWREEYSRYGLWKKRFHYFFLIRKNFLVSSNIIVSNEGDVYIVDLADITTSFFHDLLKKIKFLCAKPFIASTRKKLYELLNTKKDT